jgi:hypothetical protein
MQRLKDPQHISYYIRQILSDLKIYCYLFLYDNSCFASDNRNIYFYNAKLNFVRLILRIEPEEEVIDLALLDEILGPNYNT